MTILHTEDENQNEIFMVPVARKHLDLVYQTLARATTEAEPPPSQKGISEVTTAAIVWNKENLKKLRNGIRCEAPIKMLDMTAAKPGQRVYFSEVAHILSQVESTTRVQIGTITKVIRRELGVSYDEAIWPVDVIWDKDKNSMYYVMDEKTAQAWHDSAH